MKIVYLLMAVSAVMLIISGGLWLISGYTDEQVKNMAIISLLALLFFVGLWSFLDGPYANK